MLAFSFIKGFKIKTFENVTDSDSKEKWLRYYLILFDFGK